MSSGFAPEFDDEVAEAVDDRGVLTEAGLAVDVADGADPLGHAIEVSEFLLERREHGKAGHAGCLVSLLDRQVAADEPLHQWGRPIERSMPSDVGQIVVDLHELEVHRDAGWGCQRRRQCQTQLVQPGLNSAHHAHSNSMNRCRVSAKQRQ